MQRAQQQHEIAQEKNQPSKKDLLKLKQRKEKTQEFCSKGKKQKQKQKVVNYTFTTNSPTPNEKVG
jgi:hypothetical protein